MSADDIPEAEVARSVVILHGANVIGTSASHSRDRPFISPIIDCALDKVPHRARDRRPVELRAARPTLLSVVYPAIDPVLVSDLEQLKNGLDSGATLLIGGFAASRDRERLTFIGAQVVDSLDEFRALLHRLRERAGSRT